MRKSLLLASILLLSSTTALADGLAPPKGFYIGTELGASSLQLDSGGYNTAGSFQNTGKDTDSKSSWGIKAGVERNRWRFELNYSNYNNLDYTTNSLLGLKYKTDAKIETVMGSAYYSFYQSNALSAYAGLGAGTSHIKIREVTDGFVSAGRTDYAFAWKAEVGAEYALTNAWRLGLGVRYLDLGKIDAPLAAGAAGNFTARFRGSEVFAGLRYLFN